MRKMKITFVLLLAGLAVGCAKSDPNDAKAERAMAGMMPSGRPQFEKTYLEDQASVKTLPARTIDYKPLEEYRTANHAEPAAVENGADAANGDSADAKTPATNDEVKPAKKSGLMGLIGDKLKGGAKSEKPAKKTETENKKSSAKDVKKAESKKPAEPAKAKGPESPKASKPAEAKPSPESVKEEKSDEEGAASAEEGQSSGDERAAEERGSEEENANAEEGASGDSDREGEERKGEEGKEEGGKDEGGG